MGLFNQFKSVIQWENPGQNELFVKFTDRGDEIKNASKLILLPGQGCIFTYEGEIKGVFEEEGIYDINTDNKPFLTTIKKFLALSVESEHVVGIWFYKKGDLLNIRWGTRAPITYVDPIYTFPVELRCFGNFSLTITTPEEFFRNVVAGEELFCVSELQEILISRLVQPLTDYLANAKFSYAEIDSNVNEIALNATEKTADIFIQLGFRLTDYRIEGTSFTDATNAQIAKITTVQADVQAARMAGLDYTQMEQLKAMRDAAKNEGGAAGIGMGLGAGMQARQNMSQGLTQPPVNAEKSAMEKLKELKSLFEMELISEEEYKLKKEKILNQL